MLISVPWLIPLGIITAMVFSIGFIGWLDSRSVLGTDASQFFLIACIFVLVMALGSLITLLVI